jgi:hypothetical protein
LLLADAFNVAVCVEVTAEAVAVKLALDAPDATVTDAGTFTTLLLLVRLTVIVLLVAAVSVTVQASVPAPVSDPLLQESAPSESCEAPPPRDSLCWPNMNPGAQHTSAITPAARQDLTAPDVRLCCARASICEGWLHCNASSAATARPKEGGMRFKVIQWHLERQGTRQPFARAGRLRRGAFPQRERAAELPGVVYSSRLYLLTESKHSELQSL